jgi:hypothetical protein
MRVEQEQRVTEDARISAEQDAAAQRYAVHVLQVLSDFLCVLVIKDCGRSTLQHVLYVYKGKLHLSPLN